MSMQLALVDPGRPVGPRTAAERAVSGRAAVSAASSRTVSETESSNPQASAAVAITPVRGGLKSIDAGSSRRIAGTQQGLQFLEHAAGQLARLKSLLTGRATATSRGVSAGASPHASGHARDTAELAERIERFAALWRERASASGGSLDSQLAHVDTGEARQRFSIRGLSLPILRSGEPETLYLVFGNRTPQAAAVAIEPALPEDAIVRRFDRALAPSGVRASLDAQGELGFSVPEPAWPNIRDALTIKGGGKRFPTGQFTAVRLIPQAPVLQPELWTLDDAGAMRETLQGVIDAQARVEHAHRTLSRALIEEGQRLQAQGPEAAARLQAEAGWARAFSRSFEATAARGDYPALSALAPALLGMQRDRVLAMLGTGSTG
jgi:hypothetical protein